MRTILRSVYCLLALGVNSGESKPGPLISLVLAFDQGASAFFDLTRSHDAAPVFNPSWSFPLPDRQNKHGLSRMGSNRARSLWVNAARFLRLRSVQLRPSGALWRGV